MKQGEYTELSAEEFRDIARLIQGLALRYEQFASELDAKETRIAVRGMKTLSHHLEGIRKNTNSINTTFEKEIRTPAPAFLSYLHDSEGDTSVAAELPEEYRERLNAGGAAYQKDAIKRKKAVKKKTAKKPTPKKRKAQ